MAISTAGMSYARFTLGPLQEALQADLALSDNQIAWLQGPAIAIPSALSALPMGFIVDRYSRATLLLLFTLLNLVACLQTALATNLFLLFGARCLAGLAITGILVVAYSLVSDLYGPAQRGRATSIVAIGEVTGAPVAFALGGVLLAMSSSLALSTVSGWRWALLWLCVPLVVIALVVWTLREPARTDVTAKSAQSSQVWPVLWQLRSVVAPLLLARVMMWLADGAVLVWGAPSFSRAFELSPERIGAIMAAVLLISGLLGPALGGMLTDWCQRGGGPRRTMIALSLLALISAPAALFATLPSVALAAIVLTLFLTMGWATGTAAIALGTLVIPGEIRGTFLAIQIALGLVFCVGAAPIMVSGVSESLGGSAMIGQALAIVCGGTSVLAALIFGLAGWRYFPGLVQSGIKSYRRGILIGETHAGK